ncbi:MAG: Gfo/Idh/MocA family oxidoreductase [Bryobacterales bacterium]|nr:Gfo/Idh/MocA family oxidoreductase [Bryobacterales bacterium]
MNNATKRREFLGHAGRLAAMAAPAVLGKAQSRKLNVGIIGTGWWAGVDMKAAWAVGGVEATALCDVDTAMSDAFVAECEKGQGSKPKVYKDYRELIQHPGLDFVLLTAPPQWHALPFIAACEKGLPVYCEKPLAYDIREGQAMMAAQKKAGNVVQIGFQRRQSDAFHDAAAYLRSGRAGKIVQAEATIHYKAGTPDPTPQSPPVTLDWDTWCGPAPLRPYSPAIGHRAWRLERTTGHGHLVDWGIHLVDATRMMTGIGTPKRVQATGGIYHYKGKITTPDTLVANFEFDEFPLVWRHRLWGSQEIDPAYNNGVFFYCENETVFVTDSRWEIHPSARGAQKQVMPAKMKGNEMSEAHVKDFLDCVRAGKQPSCQIADGWESTATVQLGMIAYHTAQAIKFDAASVTIPGNKEAQAMLKREYRKPWQHPWKG